MKRCLFFLLIAGHTLFFTAHAQIIDDFSDGDFTAAPAWSGNTSDFEVNQHDQLQLKTSDAGQSYLVTPSEINENASWEFYVKLDFNPSSSNYVDVYLASDQRDLSSALNGYFVRIGNTEDEVSLYRQFGGKSAAEKIIDGADDRVDLSVVEIFIKVAKNSEGGWELLVDTTLSQNYISEGTTQDNEIFYPGFFGLFCNYTSTRSDKFYFDDLSITGEIIRDTIPPTVDSMTVGSDSTLLLFFNESLEQPSALQADNYSVNNSIGNPKDIHLIEDNSVVVFFNEKFQDKQHYELSVGGVADEFQNIMSETTIEFQYFAPYMIQIGDIIVTEIMADPTPEVDLPDAEYLEIFNTMDTLLQVKKLFLVVGTDTTSLVDLEINPAEYVILCKTSAHDLLKQYGKTVAVKNWPTLNNRGEGIIILNEDLEHIFDVSYADSWYRSNEKDDGGWSLEMIDTDHPFFGFANWSASDHPSGGTPGKANSVEGEMTDFEGPTVMTLRPVPKNKLSIRFSEPVLDSSAMNQSHYLLDNDQSIPQEISMDTDSTVMITLETAFLENVAYSVSVTGVRDYYGNVMNDTSLHFNYVPPYIVQYGDVIITEILADPAPQIDLPEHEFIELYNPLEEAINIFDAHLVVGKDTVAIPELSIDAGKYLILCPTGGLSEYQSLGRAQNIPNWPTLNNRGERISLYNEHWQLVHSVSFDDSWYRSIDKDDGGWSLEMIDTDFPCMADGNWTASSAPSGGTPGAANASAADLTDFAGVEIDRVLAIDQKTLIIQLSEIIAPATFHKEQIELQPSVSIQHITHMMPDLDRILVSLTENLLPNTVYTISIINLEDCAGNSTQRTSNQFVLPTSAEKLDILINEVLFNPRPEGIDFVEIYNNSQKYIDLKSWFLANKDTVVIADDHLIIEPGQFLALCEDFEILNNQYPGIDPDHMFEVNKLTALNDDAGDIRLLNEGIQLIDYFKYSEDYHSPFIKDAEGVSLERLSFESPTNSPDNWQSAAESAGFATPGRMNSQQYHMEYASDQILVYPKVFDPGISDNNFTIISCRFDKPGNMANIRILDSNGREIKTIARNQAIGTQEEFKWEGDNDQGEEVRLGYYIILLEIYNTDGTRKLFREKVVVGSRM
jgi:hypothetical protein